MLCLLSLQCRPWRSAGKPFAWGRSTVVRLVCLSLLWGGFYSIATAQNPPTDGPVRATLQAFFKALRDKDTTAFYRYLSKRQQAQVKREDLVKFVSQLAPLATFERGQAGEVQIFGDYAVADTVLFVAVNPPGKRPGGRPAELIHAKIFMQQYLLQENDKDWKLATGDLRTRSEFIASIPEFQKNFTLRPEKFYLLRDGKWVETASLRSSN